MTSRFTTSVRPRVAPAAALALCLIAVAAPLLVLQRGGTQGGFDQEFVHLPAIELYARGGGLNSSPAVMGPLYHLALAPIARYVSEDRLVLQCFGLLFALALVLVVFYGAARLVDGWIAFWLALPLTCSAYVLQSAGWLGTDDAALLFASMALVACAARADGRPRLMLAGAAALFAVWTRQIDLWLAGVILVAGLLSARGRAPQGRRRELARGILASLLPVGGLALLVLIWGGLTPPTIRGQEAFRPSVLPFALSLFGLFSIPFLAALGELTRASVERLVRDKRSVACAVLGAITAVLVPTSRSPGEGRSGGELWRLVDHAPAVAHRSLLLVVLAGWGGLVAVKWWRMHRATPHAHSAALLLLALAAVVAAQATTRDVYQRYFEPVILVLLALLTALALWERRRTGAPPPPRRRLVLCLGALVLIQLGGVAVGVYRKALHGPAIVNERRAPGPQEGG